MHVWCHIMPYYPANHVSSSHNSNKGPIVECFFQDGDRKNHGNRHISVGFLLRCVWRGHVSVVFLRTGGTVIFPWFFGLCLVGKGDRDISVIVGSVWCCGEGRRWRNGRIVAWKCREMNAGIRGTWCLGREWDETVRWKEETSTNKRCWVNAEVRGMLWGN